MTTTSRPAARRRTSWGSLLMGIGFGGFVDGIVLHQILQWHHMLSHREPATTLAGLELNSVADGFFHAVTWLFVLLGSFVLVRESRRHGPPDLATHVGLLLVGWGSFNLVEGTVNHHLLRIHHVRDDLGGPVSWDVGFLALSVLLLVLGWAVHRRGRARRQA
ncbi:MULTISPECIES: DUF2243 domain-containing protein [unclassified Aeromicrobium]|uniref:DUF2243 domain-containing protein n=1 Tax=unclassified Aeromicrobium TaxID=2633570 RepID=UPI00288B1604|nr:MULTISPECIES: DUF2243 domain-containing protein [unclassified Aeromicrobium]